MRTDLAAFFVAAIAALAACAGCVSDTHAPGSREDVEDTVRLLQSTRMPPFDFDHAPVADIVAFWEESINSTNLPTKRGAAELRITVDPKLRMQSLTRVSICHPGDLTFMDTLKIVCSVSDIRFRITSDGVLLLPGPIPEATVHEGPPSNNVLQDTAIQSEGPHLNIRHSVDWGVSASKGR